MKIKIVVPVDVHISDDEIVNLGKRARQRTGYMAIGADDLLAQAHLENLVSLPPNWSVEEEYSDKSWSVEELRELQMSSRYT